MRIVAALERFPFPEWVHGAFALAGTAAAVALFVAEARRRRRLDDGLVIVLLGTLICGAVGAKLATVWRYLEAAPHPSFWGAVLEGGKSVLGGLAGAYLGALLTKRAIGYRAETGDVFAPAVALGIGIGRIGCLLTELPGTPVGHPGWGWGVTLSAVQAARLPGMPAAWVGVPLHPSFLYEIAFQLAACVALLRLRFRPALRDRLFKLYLLAYALFRFAVEFVRGNEVVAWGLTRSQLFLLPSAALLAWALRRRRDLPPPLPGTAPLSPGAVSDAGGALRAGEPAASSGA
jgi:phosphatidylglycerol:prolipoprotein diacylglycerol transferase